MIRAVTAAAFMAGAAHAQTDAQAGAGLVLWLHETCPTPLPDGMVAFAELVTHDLPARQVKASSDAAGRVLMEHGDKACLKGRAALVTAMVGSINATLTGAGR